MALTVYSTWCSRLITKTFEKFGFMCVSWTSLLRQDATSIFLEEIDIYGPELMKYTPQKLHQWHFHITPGSFGEAKSAMKELLFNISRLTEEAKGKKKKKKLHEICSSFGSVRKENSTYWPSLLREQNIFGKEDRTFHAWYLNLSLLLFFFISQSLPYLGSLLTFPCSIPSMPQCQVQRQGLSSTLSSDLSNQFLKLTPATHNNGTIKTGINFMSNILQLPHISTPLS